MKSLLLIVFGCFLGWAGTQLYSGYLYGMVQNETGSDLHAICEQLLNEE